MEKQYNQSARRPVRQQKFNFAIAVFAVFSFFSLGFPAIALCPGVPSGEHAIQAGQLLRIIGRLVSPDMEGRAAGTVGERRAASFIAERFRRIGLHPVNKESNYFQTFEITKSIRLGKNNRLDLEVVGEEKVSQPETSFIPFGFSDVGERSGEVVFAGYGISARELQYDDYATLDVKDKIVLVMTHEPREKDGSSPFRTPEAFRYRGIRYKAWNAREHGAKGILIVRDPKGHPAEREELSAIHRSGGPSAGILAVKILREVADDILAPAGIALSQIQKEIDGSLSPRSFVIPGRRIHLQLDLITEKSQAMNVIGILPGADPMLRDEALVIGAHYDGLGRDGELSLAPNSYGEVHPGADDNASGVAGMLAIAEAFNLTRAKRTLVFVAFSSEEVGLLGSSAYVKEPLWPLEKTYAMVNVDMIGRLKEKRLYILGIDSAKELRNIVAGAAAGGNFDLVLSGDAYGPSDHTPFYTLGAPVLMFHTGPHADYHRPSDTADKINSSGLEKVVRVIFKISSELANRAGPLSFVRTKREVAKVRRGERSSYGAYFGSIPDFSESMVAGVRLAGVRPGSPAEDAGLKAGDVIVEFAGSKIRNLHDLLFALRSKRGGDVVEVIYQRGDKEAKARAKLTERR